MHLFYFFLIILNFIFFIDGLTNLLIFNQLGGPSWKVPLGRRDSTTANITTANTDLPGPASDLSTLISNFANQGLSVKNLVALSGYLY